MVKTLEKNAIDKYIVIKGSFQTIFGLIVKFSNIVFMQINIADSAILRVVELVTQSKDTDMIGLRVSVFGGGCSGFMYNYKLESNQNDDDLVINSNGIKFLIDPTSQPFLEGSTLEFIQELGASYFKVSNPNATGKCGCGSSFSI